MINKFAHLFYVITCIVTSIYYLNIIICIMKGSRELYYLYNFKVNIKSNNIKLIVISSILNIFILALAVYFCLASKDTGFSLLSTLLFLINIMLTKNKLSKSNNKR